MKIKHAVILGGTKLQEPLIDSLRNYAVEPLVLDRNPSCYLAKKQIKFIECDISSPKDCFQLIKDLNIIGCFTAQSDIGVPSQGYINSELNLLGVDYETAKVASNKYLFRRLMKENNIPQPKFFKCKDFQDVLKVIPKLNIPFVLKAVDSSGSRGITIIKKSSEIKAAIDEAYRNSRENYFICEEFISGIEYGAQTTSINGSLCNCFLHTDWTENNIPIGHCMPLDTSKEVTRKMNDVISEAIKALNLYGPSNVDLILDKDDNVFVLEIGARIGATCLPELVNLSTNVNLFDRQVSMAFGKNLLKDNEEVKFKNAGVRIITSENTFSFQQDQNGVINKFLKKLKKDFSLNTLNLSPENNNSLRRLNSGIDRFGEISLINQNMAISDIQKELDNVNALLIQFLYDMRVE